MLENFAVIWAIVEVSLSKLRPKTPRITAIKIQIPTFQWRFHRPIFIKNKTAIVPKIADLDSVIIIAENHTI